MNTTSWLSFWQLGLIGLLTSAGINAFVCKTLAQSTPSNIQPDATLGAESSRILQNQNFRGLPIEEIRGGAIRGINLFHSLREFNVSEGRGAYFFSPSADIQNILARVTGANGSEILGTLGTFGNSQPNLYLINPNGIIFGKNASLDVQGSFVGTTANGVKFGNQGEFSATNPEAPPLLTINPSALFVNRINQGVAITNQSQAAAGVNLAGQEVTGLRVPDGKSLLLVGGNVNLDGGNLIANSGRVELAGLVAPGNIGLNVAGNALSLNVASDVQRGNISLTNGAFVDVSGAGKGDIAINAGNLQMSNSFLLAGISTGLGDGSTKAGDININADAISLTNGAQINNLTNGKGDAGNIIVNVRDGLNISDIGSQIFSGTRIGAVGHGGNINIQAEKVVVENSWNNDGSIASITYGKGDTGDIAINTKNLIVRNSQIVSDVNGEGNAGNVQVIASESVELSGETPGNEQGNPGGIFAQVDVTGKGNAGNLYIETRRLSVSDGSKVQVATFGEGNAGSLLIRANQIDVFNTVKPYYDTGIFATVGIDPRTVKLPKGNAGDLTIETGNLSLQNGGKVAVYTQGEGNGGRLFIKASNSVEVTGNLPYTSQISAAVADSGIGNGGSITIETPQLSVTNGGEIFSGTIGKGNAGTIDIQAGNIFVKDGGLIISSTFGKGDSGNISITASDTISLDGAYIVNNVQSSDAVGNAGKIDIITGSLTAINGAEINSFTRGQGNAGTITIQARDAVTFEGQDSNGYPSGSFSSVESGAVGNGGNINITAGSLSLINSGKLGVAVSGADGNLAGGKGIGGTVNINVRDALTIAGANSGIFGSLDIGAIGRGGDIKVEAGNLFVRDGGQIISSTLGKGNAGNISITANNAISLDGTSSYIVNNVQSSDAVGNGGNIDIITGSLSATNGAQINSFTRGQGNAGNINIQARDKVIFDGKDSDGNQSGLSNSVLAGGVGNAGKVDMTADSLSLTNGGYIASGVYGVSGTLPVGKGIGGTININVRDALTVSGANSGIFGGLNTGAIGRGGDIKIEAGNLFVRDGGLIISGTRGKGNAGNISITANNAISLDGAYIASSVQSSDAVGNAGNIDIITGSLTATNSAQINSFTRGQGNAGNITIQARDAVAFDGARSDGFFIYPSALFSSVDAGAVGNGGNINITASSLSLTNGGRLEVSVNGTSGTLAGGKGIGGTVNINARDGLIISGDDSGIFGTLGNGAIGRGGNIKIESGNVEVIDGGIISSRSTGKGTAGDIEIKANSVRLNNGQINAQTAASDGGNINLNLSDYLLLRNGSQISTTAGTAQAGGDGGNININAKFIIAPPNENSDITANAFTGKGGNINIVSQGIFGIEPRPQLTDKSDITASSNFGLSGNIQILSPDNSSVQNALIQILPNAIDTNVLIAGSCIARGDKKQQNSFYITGSGALRYTPGAISPSNYSTGEVRNVSGENRRPWKKGDPIIEATGVYFLDNGQILLSRECE